MKIIKGYLIGVTQEPTIGSLAATTQELAVKKRILDAATQEPTVRNNDLLPYKNSEEK